MPETTTVLTLEKAVAAFLKHYALEIKVEDKLVRDHEVGAANLSKKSSIDSAFERLGRNPSFGSSGTKAFSFYLMDVSTVKSKLGAAPKKFAIRHAAKLQLAVPIKVKHRTVTLTQLTRVEAARIEHREIDTPTGKLYVGASSAEATVTVDICGAWVPLTGEFKAYHYEAVPSKLRSAHEAGALTRAQLTWVMDSDTPIRPA